MMKEKKSVFSFFLRDTAGAILPLAAVMMPVIIGMAGVGLDVSLWMMERRNLQTAADAAVVAAAWERANGGSVESAENVALTEAQNNGYEEGDIALNYSEDGEGNTVISTTISKDSVTLFSTFFNDEQISPTVTAAAVITTPTTDFCILSLDPSADGALTAVGNVNIDSSGCGIAVNSNSGSALDLTGNTSVTIGDVSIVGNDSVNGSVTFDYDNLTTGAARTPDPYADLEVPAFGACNHNNLSVNSDATLNPGVYCGGLSITGNNTVTFNPGVYYIVDGDFSVTGNGAMIGNGVSFVLTSSGASGSYGDLDISGGKVITFTAPADGALSGAESSLEGMVFYQDRNANTNSCSSLTGNAEIEVDGAMYFPSNCLTFGGTSGASSVSDICTRIIAKTVKLHGTPNLANGCDDSDAEDISQYRVKLYW